MMQRRRSPGPLLPFVAIAIGLAPAWAAAQPAPAAAFRSPATSSTSSRAAALPSPRVRARAAIVYNAVTGEVLWESNAQDQRSIASLTKVMTAVVFLEQAPALTRDVVIARSDVRRASTTYLRAGERVRLDELLHLSLIASDNGAARALARVSPWGTRGFVEQMNRKAAELKLESTRFADPSGLDAANVSSAYDISRLIAYASRNQKIAAITQKRSYSVRTSRRRLTIRNTNRLLDASPGVRAGKTGYISEAGYCLAALIQLPQSDPLAVVVLGARSNAGRFSETRRLVNWLSTTARALIRPADATD